MLDLSKPEDRKRVEELHLDLKATDRPEYFRTTVNRSVVKKLEAAKINWTAYPLLPDRTFAPEYIESEKERKKVDSGGRPESAVKKDPSDLYYYNTFEESNWYDGKWPTTIMMTRKAALITGGGSRFSPLSGTTRLPCGAPVTATD